MRIYAYLAVIVLGSSTAIAGTETSSDYRNLVTHPSLKIAAEVFGACVTYSNGSLQCTPSTLQSACPPSSTQMWIQGGQCPQ